MPEGLIIKALSGYYYVRTCTLPDFTLQCRARGVFKKKGVSPLVGDRVVYERTENDEGTVMEILPRTSELIRPPIANVDLAVLVFSVDEPAVHLQLLDKFLVHMEFAGLAVIICLTKCDLLDGTKEKSSKLKITMDELVRLYQGIGYPVVGTSVKTNQGIDELKKRLSGKISVLSGQSGVGKSSLLNAMLPELELETGEISVKLGRGRHTTRHVELIELEKGSFVADTPGFSQLDFAGLEAEQLPSCFREFEPWAKHCKFRGCLHQNEPGCGVVQAKERNDIAASRYEHYLQFLTEIKERKRRY